MILAFLKISKIAILESLKFIKMQFFSPVKMSEIVILDFLKSDFGEFLKFLKDILPKRRRRHHRH